MTNECLKKKEFDPGKRDTYVSDREAFVGKVWKRGSPSRYYSSPPDSDSENQTGPGHSTFEAVPQRRERRVLKVREKRKEGALKAIGNIATSYLSIDEQGKDWLS